MKISGIQKLVLFGSVLFQTAASSHNAIEEQQLQAIELSSTFDMLQDFRTPKKVFFACEGGGSSHTHWVLSILNELDSRGHNTTFLTRDSHTTHSKKYPNINTLSLGPETKIAQEIVAKALTQATQLDFKVYLFEKLSRAFENSYSKIFELMEKEKYDVAICDSFTISCQEAANKLRIPFIITSSIPQSSDAAAPYINNDMMNINVPTTEFMNFWQRLNVKVIQPVEFLWKSRNSLIQEQKVFKSYGIEAPLLLESRWTHSVKMYNTAFGIQRARPVGPLVEFVGPIIKTRVPRLSPELETYLESHERVAYVGFGQHATLSQTDTTLILTGLLEAYEHNDIDGIIWATREVNGNFPAYLTTQSNTTFDVSKFFHHDNASDILFVSWAPQMAILSHPSVSLFVSHGGSASIYESLYAGVRMVIYPFFGDQPGASVTGEQNGYALRLDSKKSQEEATAIIRRIARDTEGTFQKNTNRFKALVQIRTKHGILKGADLVEEVMFLNENGKITHRRDVKYDVSFLKATNLDVYTFAAFVVGGVLYSIIRLLINAGNLVAFKNSKIKTL